VREACVERDGGCRLAGLPLGPCSGVLGLAHLGEWKRFNTRGLEPEERHLVIGAFVSCAGHHRAYDAHEFDLGYGPKGADGRLDVILRKAVA
jgi:hypothetical protein